MHLIKAVAILVARVFSRRMIDRLVLVSPFVQPHIDIVLIGNNQAPDLNGLFEDRLDRLLLDIREHVQDDLSIALDHAQDGRFFTRQSASPRLSFQPSAATGTPQLGDNFGMTFVTRHNIDFIALYFTAQTDRLFLTAIPSRNCVVMTWTSS
jgi:hypothetical protein